MEIGSCDVAHAGEQGQAFPRFTKKVEGIPERKE